jgi:hypothetical protein
MPAPVFNDHMRFFQRVKDLTVEQVTLTMGEFIVVFLLSKTYGVRKCHTSIRRILKRLSYSKIVIENAK